MHQAILKLLSLASEPLGSPVGAPGPLNEFGSLGNELAEMLALKNGFYAYESALLVRPLRHPQNPLGLTEWNAVNLWKREYRESLDNVLFFAEDIFGGQFCIRESGVCVFDPETGTFQAMSHSLGAWAEQLMTDYPIRTGYRLAHDWQMANGVLPAGMRLLPKIPFVCGGKYELNNLYAVNDTQGMRFRASIANQIRDLPDGAEIVIRSSGSAPPT